MWFCSGLGIYSTYQSFRCCRQKFFLQSFLHLVERKTRQNLLSALWSFVLDAFAILHDLFEPSAKSLQLRVQIALISQQRCTRVQQHTLGLERLTKPHLEASIQLMTKTEDKQRRCVCTRQILTTACAHRASPYQRSNAAALRWYHTGPLAALLGNKHSEACKLLLDVALLPRDRRHKNMLWSQRTAFRRDYRKTILLTFHMTVQALCSAVWPLTRQQRKFKGLLSQQVP